MKYALTLLGGIVVGVALFAIGMYYNPFAEQLLVSPLAVTNEEQLDFSFTAVPGETILYTDNGETSVTPHPDRVAELWEPTIVDTRFVVTLLNDGRGEVAALGIKFSSDSEQSSLIGSRALVNSAWHIYIPQRGTLLVDQVENYWSYLREIVVPARWSSGDNWMGSYFRIVTDGPNALGTARVTGGTGDFSGLSSEAIETLTARAYSDNQGLVSANGGLTISLQPAIDASE